MFREVFKKSVSVLLAILLVVGAVPLRTVTVYALDDESGEEIQTVESPTEDQVQEQEEEEVTRGPETAASVAVVTHDGADTGYETLAAAIEAAEAGDTVTLLADTTEEQVNVSKDLTLDLGDYTYTGELTAWDGTVTVQNGKIAGRLDAYDSAVVTLASDAEVEGQVVVWGDGTSGQEGCKTPVLNVYGKVTNTGDAAISTNGSDKSFAEINIYAGAEVTSTDD
ncbi:MAG: hypothetical protein II474_03600, partial [Firmicutes bacterium]|nr:hypothetical protein [Bacillota bacterium]